jgi:hypothetical protein
MDKDFPALLNLRYALSGDCPICHDLLLGPSALTAELASAKLDSTFEQHWIDRHKTEALRLIPRAEIMAGKKEKGKNFVP